MSKFLIALLMLTSATPALATSWHKNNHYWVAFNFSANAFGKEVAGVYAHVGALRSGGSNCGFWETWEGQWESVQHVKLERQGDHFFAKTSLETYDGECRVSTKGPIVQYWVYFTDGSQLQTDSSLIPLIDTTDLIRDQWGYLQWSESVKANDRDFDNVKDAPATFGYRLEWGYAS